jgi:hypothetical protein
MCTMMHMPPLSRRMLAALLTVVVFFGANASVANAQLANLITSGISAGTGAAIACNKDKISKGIASIFGGGGNFDGGGDSGVGGMGGSGTVTSDGELDSITTHGSGVTYQGSGSFIDPAANPGMDFGTPKGIDSTIPDQGGGRDVGLFNVFGDLSNAQAVPVTNKTIEDNAKKTAAATAATTKKLTCTNAIERAAAQTILKQMTISTVNWINSGFQGGGPLFLGNPTAFFKNIQDQIVKDFSARIGFDNLNYPFGRMVVKQLADDLANTFESHARYSLNQVVGQQVYGATSASFFADFSTGGWDAFLALTSFNNNPYGFNMAARDELAYRIADTNYTPARDIMDQLTRNGGLLDLKKCVDPANFDPETMPNSACRYWENQTPGSVISSQLNMALGSPFRQLELGQDLNADLTAIFDALANQLVSKGLRSLSTSMSGATKTATKPVTYTNNGSYVSNVTVDGNGDSTNFLSAGNAYQTNIFSLDPSGKDASDPTGKRVNLVALINREKLLISTDYDDSAKLAKAFGWTTTEEAAWISTITSTDANYRNLLGRQVNLTKRLVPAILQLDYCIPGPHPSWQNDSTNNLNAFLADNNRLPQNVTTLPSWVTKIPLIGGIFGGVDNLNADKKNEAVYAGVIGNYLKADVEPNVKTNGYGAAANIFGTLYNRYAAQLTNAYSPLAMKDAVSPALSSKNATEFARLPSYMKAMSGNAETIASTEVVIDQLIRLGASVRALQTNTPALEGYPSPVNDEVFAVPVTYDDYQLQFKAIARGGKSKLTEYGRALKRINDTFALIAPDLLSDTDITEQEAALDAVALKLQDLAGPGGDIEQCVKEVAAQTAGPAGRMPYPPSLAAYLPAEYVALFKTTPSFLPDYYYGQGQGAAQIAAFSSQYGFAQDPKKVIPNDDVVTINRQEMPNSLAGLETLLGMY